MTVQQKEYLRNRAVRLRDKRRFGCPQFLDLSKRLKLFMPKEYEINKLKLGEVSNLATAGIPRRYSERHFERDGSCLKIDIAGSGHQSFRSDHLGLTGKNEILKDNGKRTVLKLINVSWYNTFFGRFIKWIQTPEQINAKNAEILAGQAKFKEQFGTSVMTSNGKTYEHIYKRYSKKSTKYSMAGPLGGIFGLRKGARNSGTYSIENLRKYIFTAGTQYIKDKIRYNESHPDQPILPITIDLRGHSRGAVASVEGAMMIKAWLRKTYPALLPDIKFRLVQNDPVPGFGSMTGHDSYNHGGEPFVRDGLNMEPLGESADTTVVYSMHTEHNHFFTPQSIKGAKRVILTPLTHMVGLKDLSDTVGKREGFVYQGQSFGSRALNELPEGVYILDEKNNLMRFDSASQAKDVLDTVLQGISKQSDRHDILKDVVSTWFKDNPEHSKNIDANKEASESKQQASGDVQL